MDSDVLSLITPQIWTAKANTAFLEYGLRIPASQFPGFLLQILIPGLTPDFLRTGPKNQDLYQTPHGVPHTKNFENLWLFDWNGGQEVARKYSKSSLSINRFLELQQNDYNETNFIIG